MRKRHSILLVACLLAPALARAQATISVNVNTASSEAHVTTIGNAESRSLQSIELTLNGVNATWDSFNRTTGATFTATPTLGTDGDSQRANKITIVPTTALPTGSSIGANGDIDSDAGIVGITARMTWTNGWWGQVALTKSGTVWSATVPPQNPPGSTPSPSTPVHLSWTPATQNTDGSPYTNPSGFRVYWGTQSGQYPNNVQLNNPGLAAYDVEGLTPNVPYFFVITSLNLTGDESVFSNVATATPAPDAPSPLPPGSLVAVSGNVLAYTISTVLNAITLQAVGTIDGGTPCDKTQKLNAWGDGVDAQKDLFLITQPTTGLHFFGGVSADVVFAPCGS